MSEQDARGLSRSELPPEILRAGETVEYFSWQFICGDPRGRRVTRVLDIRQQDDADYPVRVATDEIIPSTMLMKRVLDCDGNPVSGAYWRKVRTYILQDGSVTAPTARQLLTSALQRVVDDSFAEIHAQLASKKKPGHVDSKDSENVNGCYSSCGSQADEDDRREFQVIDLCSSESEDAEALVSVDITPSPSASVLDKGKGTCGDTVSAVVKTEPGVGVFLSAAAAIDEVKTYKERSAIRRQRKRRPGDYHVRFSRKKKYQAKRAAVRDSQNVYHARALMAKFAQAYACLPEVRKALAELRERRAQDAKRLLALCSPDSSLTTSVGSAAESVPNADGLPVVCTPSPSGHGSGVADRVFETADWPSDVLQVSTLVNPRNVVFEDIGDFGCCDCDDDCYRDTCHNAAGGIYCEGDNCNIMVKYKTHCTNSVRIMPSLRLFKGRIELGVYTTMPVEAGEIICEYCGVLDPYHGIETNQPLTCKNAKRNSGYTLLLNTREKFEH